MEKKRKISLGEAVESWEDGPSKSWRKDKMKRDGRKQLNEIERHKYLLSEKCGHDVGWETAALDWVQHHAADWRRWWEEQPGSGA